ncbi:hypothetical protein C2G38_267379 [Gigaspora rosea]|uniref:Secreted protein n=1 Tax=Gigaspora rosea TaxID=44941 RepID=A0A397UPZ9_9GLOM|nr:hypothetical protein C2G38_267379 [Gigaspora rosea]
MEASTFRFSTVLLGIAWPLAKRASVSDICTAASDNRASVCCPTRQRSGFNTGQCMQRESLFSKENFY